MPTPDDLALRVEEVFDEALAPFAARLVEAEFMYLDAERAEVDSVMRIWFTYFRRRNLG